MLWGFIRTMTHEIPKIKFGCVQIQDWETDKNNIYEAVKGADAIVVLTEWEEYSKLDWKFISKQMRQPAWIFDSRVFLDKQYLKNIGFKVWSLGS